MTGAGVRFLARNLDEIAILGAFASLAFEDVAALDEAEQRVLAALRRLDPSLADLSPDEIGDHLAGFGEESIGGLVSAVKGILHEMEFVLLENSDGEAVLASMFADPSHEGFDVQVFDSSSRTWEDLQLKATDDAAYVREWIEAHPEGRIAVTEELAEELGLESTGVSNAELTARVEEFVEKLIDHDFTASLENALPGLGVLSAALVVMELHARYRAGELEGEGFLSFAGRVAGLRFAKLGGILLALSVPGLNTVVAAAMVARLIHGAGSGLRA